jgi:hypothetical protein
LKMEGMLPKRQYTKSEARISKFETNRNPKSKENTQKASCLSLLFRISYLFRASDFEFRTWATAPCKLEGIAGCHDLRAAACGPDGGRS